MLLRRVGREWSVMAPTPHSRSTPCVSWHWFEIHKTRTCSSENWSGVTKILHMHSLANNLKKMLSKYFLIFIHFWIELILWKDHKIWTSLKFHFWPSTKRYLQPRSETGSWKNYVQLNFPFPKTQALSHWPIAIQIKVCPSMSFCVQASSGQGRFPFSLCVVILLSVTRSPQRCVIIYKKYPS